MKPDSGALVRVSITTLTSGKLSSDIYYLQQSHRFSTDVSGVRACAGFISRRRECEFHRRLDDRWMLCFSGLCRSPTDVKLRFLLPWWDSLTEPHTGHVTSVSHLQSFISVLSLVGYYTLIFLILRHRCWTKLTSVNQTVGLRLGRVRTDTN